MNKDLFFIPVCTMCGTRSQDEKTGFCINGHDSWLEQRDHIDNFKTAAQATGLGLEAFYEAFETNADIKIINPKQI